MGCGWGKDLASARATLGHLASSTACLGGFLPSASAFVGLGLGLGFGFGFGFGLGLGLGLGVRVGVRG